MIYKADNLSFRYPTGGKPVLDGVSLTLEEGEILTVLGPNGAGKSTLLGCMLGLLRPQSGSVQLCGKELRSLGARRTALLVSYVRQTQTAAFSYSVADYVLMGRAPMLGAFRHPGKKDRAAAQRAMTDMGIERLADKPVDELSGGERQQAMIARAIVREPKAILLDEPTSHLDYGNQLRALRMIKRLSETGYSLVVTTHNPDHAILLGGRTAIIDHSGHMRTGAAKEMLREDILRDVYGAELRLCYQPEVNRSVCIYPNL